MLFVVFSMMVISCKNHKKINEPDSKQMEGDTSMNSLPADFLEFYDRFHKDSAFQMQHITFPLDGAIRAPESNGDSLIPYRWRMNKWQLHHEYDNYNNIFTRKFIIYNQDLIIEQITGVNDLFKMERRFGKLSDGWNLIYYSVN